MEVKCKTHHTLPLDALSEFQGNLKDRDSDDVEKIIKSINEHGFSIPFFVWKHGEINHVLDGHGRLKALKKMQKKGEHIPALPVVFVQCKDEADAKKLLLKINSQYGKMTADSVLEFLGEIEMDFDDISLPMGKIEFDIAEPVETTGDDEVPEEQETVISQLGEMYELGNSILMCGDSTNAEDVARLMGGEKADLVFTDPPYGMKKEKEGVLNDNLNFDDLLEFNKKWIPLSFKHLKENGSWYCWGIDEPLMDIYSNILKPMSKEQKITFRNLITWDKGSGQGQNAEEFRVYAIADEKCLFVMAGVQGFNNNADNYFEAWEDLRVYFETEIKKFNLSDLKIANKLGFKDGRTVNHWYSKSQWGFIPEENYKALQSLAASLGVDALKKEYDALKKEYDALKKEYYKTRAYFNNTHDNMNNVWHFERTNNEERKDTGGHATPKPIALCERAIKTSSRENDIILDLFGGSGSTLIAAEKNNRKARLMELDPHYCDVIRRRWTKWAKENGREIGSGGLE